MAARHRSRTPIREHQRRRSRLLFGESHVASRRVIGFRQGQSTRSQAYWIDRPAKRREGRFDDAMMCLWCRLSVQQGSEVARRCACSVSSSHARGGRAAPNYSGTLRDPTHGSYAHTYLSPTLMPMTGPELVVLTPSRMRSVPLQRPAMHFHACLHQGWHAG